MTLSSSHEVEVAREVDVVVALLVWVKVEVVVVPEIEVKVQVVLQHDDQAALLPPPLLLLLLLGLRLLPLGGPDLCQLEDQDQGCTTTATVRIARRFENNYSSSPWPLRPPACCRPEGSRVRRPWLRGPRGQTPGGRRTHRDSECTREGTPTVCEGRGGGEKNKKISFFFTTMIAPQHHLWH